MAKSTVKQVDHHGEKHNDNADARIVNILLRAITGDPRMAYDLFDKIIHKITYKKIRWKIHGAVTMKNKAKKG